MDKLTIEAGTSRYDVTVGRGLRGDIASRLGTAFPKSRFALITDENVDRLYGTEMHESFTKAGLSFDTIAVAPGEASKSIAAYERILRTLAAKNYNRADVIVALGGGVVGDLAGFVAASLLRGVPYVQVPTTLLSQIDSSVGGKTAVNLPEGKNLVGAFYHPAAVYIDIDFLQTLPEADFADGMAELIKDFMIKDERALTQLERAGKVSAGSEVLQSLIVRCLEIKRDVVAQDEKDKGERMKLNFGHTIGHGLERLCAVGGRPMTHGQAVARGMAAITAKSEAMGQTQAGTSARLAALLKTAGLPGDIDGFDKDEILSGILRDKKNIADKLHIILIEKPGQAFIHSISAACMIDYL